jgi:hypothetical protein
METTSVEKVEKVAQILSLAAAWAGLPFLPCPCRTLRTAAACHFQTAALMVETKGHLEGKVVLAT